MILLLSVIWLTGADLTILDSIIIIIEKQQRVYIIFQVIAIFINAVIYIKMLRVEMERIY